MDAWRLDCTGTYPKGELLTDVIKDQDAEITRLKAEIERLQEGIEMLREDRDNLKADKQQLVAEIERKDEALRYCIRFIDCLEIESDEDSGMGMAFVTRRVSEDGYYIVLNKAKEALS